MLSQARWTHVALPVSNLERSLEFYTTLTPLVVVARNSDGAAAGSPDLSGTLRVAAKSHRAAPGRAGRETAAAHGADRSQRKGPPPMMETGQSKGVLPALRGRCGSPSPSLASRIECH